MGNPGEDMRAYVRGLARQWAEIAASDENKLILRRWRDVNALRTPDRPPVWCRPVGAWAEILPESALRCTEPWLRGLEREFRRALIKHDIGDDSPLDPHFTVGAAFDVTPQNIWGLGAGRHSTGAAGGAWAYDPPLKTEADFDRLALPSFTYNHARTNEALDKTHDLLGDILPVQLVCHPPLSAILCTAAADLHGLSEMMLDMVMRPELMHRLMAHLRDGVLKAMDEVEATGLLTPNNIGPMTCSDPLDQDTGTVPSEQVSTAADGSPRQTPILRGDETDPVAGRDTVTYKQCWVSTNSQEFDGVSPEMWETFLLDYQRPILERFGLVCYGCCENLTHKMDGVLSIPNLRIFVSSAWTNLDKVIERVGTRHVIMWRQKASDVVFTEDVATLEHDLEEGLRRLQGCHVQIVLRELQTLAGHPDRLHVWTRLAKEAAAKYA